MTRPASPPVLEDPIEPGATLGVMGGGQLGRMFARAASVMGYRVHVYAPESDPPAVQVAAGHHHAAWDDEVALDDFAAAVAAVTVETENVPVAALRHLARLRPVRPGPDVVAIAQDRGLEKAFLAGEGLPVVPHALVHDEADLPAALDRTGLHDALKTTRFGYDGKGQRLVRGLDEAVRAWEQLRAPELVAEAWIEFEAELSVVVARSPDGTSATYGPFRNVHRDHILDHVALPGGFDPEVEREAVTLAKQTAAALELEGVCCVEMFLRRDGGLAINEIAPRPHNSGHLTIEACVTSQFEQQVRTMCGLPPGSPDLRVGGAAMANVLGDLWPGEDASGAAAAPPWARVLARPDVHLHLYGKSEPRPGRKMGHLVVCGADSTAAREAVLAARSSLVPSASG